MLSSCPGLPDRSFFRALILSMKLKVNAVNLFPTYKLKQGWFVRSYLVTKLFIDLHTLQRS